MDRASLLEGELDDDQAPPGHRCPAANWCTRPFRRYNTQSEPEELLHGSSDFSDEDLPECSKCCDPHCYDDIRRYPAGGLDSDDKEEECDDALQEDEERGRGVVDVIKGWMSSQTVLAISLLVFISLPMFARQLGSITARRILSRFFLRP